MLDRMTKEQRFALRGLCLVMLVFAGSVVGVYAHGRVRVGGKIGFPVIVGGDLEVVVANVGQLGVAVGVEGSYIPIPDFENPDVGGPAWVFDNVDAWSVALTGRLYPIQTDRGLFVSAGVGYFDFGTDGLDATRYYSVRALTMPVAVGWRFLRGWFTASVEAGVDIPVAFEGVISNTFSDTYSAQASLSYFTSFPLTGVVPRVAISIGGTL